MVVSGMAASHSVAVSSPGVFTRSVGSRLSCARLGSTARADVLADPRYMFTEVQKIGRCTASLGVPLLREGMPIGARSACSTRTCDQFTDKRSSWR
jgi:hypothetical protein